MRMSVLHQVGLDKKMRHQPSIFTRAAHVDGLDGDGGYQTELNMHSDPRCAGLVWHRPMTMVLWSEEWQRVAGTLVSRLVRTG